MYQSGDVTINILWSFCWKQINTFSTRLISTQSGVVLQSITGAILNDIIKERRLIILKVNSLYPTDLMNWQMADVFSWIRALESCIDFYASSESLPRLIRLGPPFSPLLNIRKKR